MIAETLDIISTESPEWMHYALCSDADPELFYPPEPDLDNVARVAVNICNHCPVKAWCLMWALNHEREGYRFGIWGGKTANQRTRLKNRIRKQRRVTSPASLS